MMDCFGIDVTTDEIARWNWLTATGDPYVRMWNHGGPPLGADDHRDVESSEEFDNVWFRGIGHQHRLVDVGCGIGHKAMWIVDRCDEYIGIDISTFAIAQASWAFRNKPARFLHTVYDADEVRSLHDVDCFLGVNFWYHQPPGRAEIMLGFMAERISDGGIIVVDTIVEEEFPTDLDVELGGQWYCWKTDLNIERHGLEIVGGWDHRHGGPPWTRRNLILGRRT